jgi:hypothetical protein
LFIKVNFFPEKPENFLKPPLGRGKMKKITVLLLLVNIFSVIHAKDLWEKYLVQMEQFKAPRIDEKVLLDVLRARYPLSENKQENIEELIRKGLEDNEGAVRKGSILYLAKHRMRCFSKILVEKIPEEAHVAEKKWLIWAFGEVGKSEDVLALVQYLRNEKNPYLINLLAAALSKISHKDGNIEPLLLLAQNSRNLYVKSTAILGLGKIGDSRAFPMLWKMAVDHPVKEIRFCSVIALSSVMMKGSKQMAGQLQKLKNRFQAAGSIYEKLALAYTIQKVGGFEKGLYTYMVGFLDKPVLSEVAIDFLENLLFPQAEDRLEMVLTTYPAHMNAVKKRINNLLVTLRRIR